jgi:glycosyltransferase involved in cell wall biosynthesis
MNILFVFYIPSGGVDTLNRQRCHALKRYGLYCHCLYFREGSGLQNTDHIPTFITDKDETIKEILEQFNYKAIIIVSAYAYLQRFRMLGYLGHLIFEIQGFGAKETARADLTYAYTLVNYYADGILLPGTPHIKELIDELYPHKKTFEFNTCLDTAHFTYIKLPKHHYLIFAWIGRIEDNKNWSEFLIIGNELRKHYPDIRLWMFEDNTLSTPKDRLHFNQMIDSLELHDILMIRANIPHAKMPEYLSIIGDSGGLLISTSKVEGAPYSVLEAMACLCPVLTTDSDGVRRSVIHNQTGKYYTLGNINEAVKEAKELIQFEKPRWHYSFLARIGAKKAKASILLHKRREKIRKQAQKHVQDHFNPDLYCHNFMRMLQQLELDPSN